MVETKTEVLDKLAGLIEKLNPEASAHMVVCASGVASSIAEMAKFINSAKMVRLGRLIFAGQYGPLQVYVDPSMDQDDVRIFNGYGTAVYNLFLEGFKPEDFV